MADSLNQQIADALTRRQVLAGRVEASLRREVLEHLAVLEQDILAAIKRADPTQFALLSRRRREVETLMQAELDPLIQERYARIAALLDAALLRLARNEAEAVETLVNDVTGQETIEEQPTDRQVRAGVVHGIFPSASKPTDLATFASDWWTRAAASVSQRIGDSLTTGIALEENLVELTRRIRGTSEQAFTDGIMAKARSDATRLLTTQMTNALGEARSAVAAVNASRIILSHVSLRDGHTSLICIARDGKRFTATPDHTPIGHDLPYLQGVPYHPN